MTINFTDQSQVRQLLKYLLAGARQLSFWYDTDFTVYRICEVYNWSLSYQKKNWWSPAHQALFWYDNDSLF